MSGLNITAIEVLHGDKEPLFAGIAVVVPLAGFVPVSAHPFVAVRAISCVGRARTLFADLSDFAHVFQAPEHIFDPAYASPPEAQECAQADRFRFHDHAPDVVVDGGLLRQEGLANPSYLQEAS